MDDRVGDILAARARLEGGPAPALIVSLLFHAFLSGLAAWSAWHAGVQQVPSVMMIRFAKPAPVADIAPLTPAVTAPPVSAPAPKPVQKPKPRLVEKTVLMSPFGKSKKKGREELPPLAPPRVAAPPAPVPAASAQDVPVGSAGVTALEGGDFPYAFYIEQMKRIIGTHWLRPPLTGDASTVIYFTIERDGTIRQAKAEINSGNGLFDRAALRAVLEASPLPPLPFGYSGTYLGVHLKFR